MKKKLLMITPGPKFSIDTKFYDELSKHFDGCILTSSSAPEMLELDNVSGFEMHVFKYYYGKRKVISNLVYVFGCIRFTLISLVKRHKYDLVVTYDPLKSGMMGAIISWVLRAKFAPEVNGVYTSPAEYIDAPDTIILRLKKYIIPKVMRVVIRRASGIKLLFDSQLDPFKDILGGKLIRRFPNHVDIEKFEQTEGCKEVLFVGFPFKRKGVDILISAFKKVAAQYPDWKLKILGWYPNPDILYKAIDNHPQISHHAPVSSDKMPAHIGACSIFVLPSRSEAMGRVLIETMAAGKPRIGANVDGIPTVINDGEDGLLFKPECIDDLAGKLDMLMGDENLRNQLGQNGAKRARREFTKDVYFHNKVKFYEDVLSG